MAWKGKKESKQGEEGVTPLGAAEVMFDHPMQSQGPRQHSEHNTQGAACQLPQLQFPAHWQAIKGTEHQFRMWVTHFQ